MALLERPTIWRWWNLWGTWRNPWRFSRSKTRISTPYSLRPRPEAARRKESAKKDTRRKGAKRKGGIEFTKRSRQLIQINRTTKVQSKEAIVRSRMNNIAKSLAMRNLWMVDRAKKGLVARGLLIGGLVVRGLIERSLIGKGDTERSPNTMSLIITTMMRRWKIWRKSTLLLSTRWRGKT